MARKSAFVNRASNEESLASEYALLAADGDATPVADLAVLAAATAVIGLIWTIRIFRGPRDEPPRWRYRNR